ncbi:MAG: ROK family protein [Bacteroidales bacterium]|jgi:glucokinase|nr:ROK family protein [Bacteroidales bacterium]MDD4394313.1 ROK family protein [Bacteroidales bacterium]
MKSGFAIGIDIGGTNTDMGIVNPNGECIKRMNIPTQSFTKVEDYADEIANVIRKMLLSNNITNIDGIGIGAPNGNYFSGTIDYAPNLPFKGKIFLKQLINERLQTKVVLTNDANAAAYGEKIYGNAKNMNDFIIITMGTGIGSGIFVDGKLVYGHDGFAGELGHCILFPDGRKCSCGRKGCLEQYAAARGIQQTYIELRNNNEDKGLLADIENPSCQELSKAANEGDPLAIQTWAYTGYLLGIALSNAVAFSSPEAIFLMGGPMKAGKWLLDPLRQSFEEHLLPIYQNKITIATSQLKENDVAILGAAALVYEK